MAYQRKSIMSGGDGQAPIVGWDGATKGTTVEGEFLGWRTLNAKYKPLARVRRPDGQEILLKAPHVLEAALQSIKPGDRFIAVYDKKGTTAKGNTCHFFESIDKIEGEETVAAKSEVEVAYAELVKAKPAAAQAIRNAAEGVAKGNPAMLVDLLRKAVAA